VTQRSRSVLRFASPQNSVRKVVVAVVMTTSVVAVAVLMSAAGQADSDQFDPNSAILMPAETVQWTVESGGVTTAQGYGNKESGEYGSFVTFPPDFKTPVHRHTNFYHGVVISGTVINPMADDSDEQEVRLGPGSYWYVPAGEAHLTACVSDIPCTYYTHSTELFDFVPNDE